MRPRTAGDDQKQAAYLYVAPRQAARLDDGDVDSNFYLVSFHSHLYLTTVLNFCLLVN